MIRRTFLKALAALPFVGKMPVVQGRVAGPAIGYVKLSAISLYKRVGNSTMLDKKDWVELDETVMAPIRKYMTLQGINIEGDETSLRPFPCQPTDT